MIPSLALLIVLSFHSPLGFAAPLPSDVNADARMLGETNRALEEEVKLASRAQIYLVLDLAEGALLIKGRGIELHRLPLLHWETTDETALGRTFRLHARPPLTRPKLAPGEDPAETVIDLEDMPAEYELGFEPDLVIAVSPPAAEQPWLWAMSRLREWGHQFAASQATVRLRLALGKEDARSLAWSIIDGMPLIVRRKMM
jgi:hypothetical protein